jgi:RNA polymerase sigma-70 factor (ECF subfamily)
MPRDNQAWLADLRASGAIRDAALADLRAVLQRVLPRALSGWLPPASGHFDPFLEDVIQETLLRLLDRLDSFEGRSQFTTWACKIAIRIALNELRHRKWKEVSLEGLEQGGDLEEPSVERFTAGAPLPETVLERRQAIALVERILVEELTPRQRAAMAAIGVKGVSMDEVARRMGTNRNALYKTMHDARLRLKRRLKREGYVPQELLDLFGK